MNYIEQIKGFWLAQEVYQLGTSEIALYFHLLEVCNKTGWTGTFYRNNYKVMSDLSIRSYKTFQSVRDRLKGADIIDFKQKNGDANCQYSLKDLGKKYLGKVEGKVKGSGEGKVKGQGKGSVEDNINQTKTKPNKSKSHSGKPDDEEKSGKVHWKKFYAVWHAFYLEKFESKYNYLKRDAKHLEGIYRFLEKRAVEKKGKFTEEYMETAFKFFLQQAWEKDEWLKRNFSTANVLSQFNQIVNAKASGQNSGGAQSKANPTNLADPQRYSDKA